MKLTRFLSAVLLVCTLSVTQRISAQERTGQGSQREQPQGQPHGSQSQQHSERPQQRGGQEQGVGGGHIPQHGPPPVRTPPAQPQQGQRTERQGQQGQQRRAYQGSRGIQKPLTFTPRTIAGWGTTLGGTILITI